MNTLTESLGSKVTTVDAERRTVRTDEVTVTVTVTGCGYEDQEVFPVSDVRVARAAMRKLMATAIRQFGRDNITTEE